MAFVRISCLDWPFSCDNPPEFWDCRCELPCLLCFSFLKLNNVLLYVKCHFFHSLIGAWVVSVFGCCNVCCFKYWITHSMPGFTPVVCVLVSTVIKFYDQKQLEKRSVYFWLPGPEAKICVREGIASGTGSWLVTFCQQTGSRKRTGNRTKLSKTTKPAPTPVTQLLQQGPTS